MECSNWRGITLLNTLNKVIAKTLHRRIFDAIDMNLRPEQAGFRPNKSCIDHINSLRIIVEQSAELRVPLYLIFIDFQRAFDSIHQSAIWQALTCKGVPPKIIRLIKALYDNSRCRVLHEGLKSNQIDINVGVRQGCILSPLLFNIVLDLVLAQSIAIDGGINLGLTSKLNDLDYADDICLISHNFSDMQQTLALISANAGEVGLKLNTTKTKSLRLNTANTHQFSLLDQHLEDVNEYIYLGSIIDKSG